MYAISDAHERIMVLMTHNTDISDAWEREGEDPRFFYQFSPDGYAVGHQRAHVCDDPLSIGDCGRAIRDLTRVALRTSPIRHSSYVHHIRS